MGYVKNGDIVAFRVGEEIVCAQDGCMTKEEMEAWEEEDIICQREVENSDGYFFCDRCKKRI
jgi:hypothetical protein